MAEETHTWIIVDLMYNHFGRSDLDVCLFDSWSENEKEGICLNDRRSHTLGGETPPDYGRNEGRHNLCDNALVWVKEYHADRLR